MKVENDILRRVWRLALCVGLVAGFQFSVFSPARAQDQHFSMLDLDPLLFNPAYSGFFDGTARYGVVYRNQWASVSAPFQTLSATAEVALMRSSRHRNGLSGGLVLCADRAGSLGYGTTQATAVASYFQGLGDGRHIVSLAVEAGAGQAGFNDNGMVMDDGSETFGRTHTLYPTLGAGAAWFWQVNDVLYAKLGLGARNLNEPDVGLLDQASDPRLSRRYNVYARAEWRMAEGWSLLPVAGYQRQRGFSELVYGCDVRWYVRDTPRGSLALGAGIIGRHADAAAVTLAVLWREWTFAFSYDANLSTLAQASHTIGAFEVGVVYLASKPKGTQQGALPCPIF